MHFNPFARGRYVSRTFGRYPRPMNLFDRIVGRPDQMSILDYLLVAPFIFKLLYHVSKNKPVLRAIFGFITVPFAIAKFAIYVAVSPLTFLFWAASKIITKQVGKYAKSPFTRELNKLTVKGVAKPGQQQESVVAQPLSKVNKLYDVSHMRYSIKLKPGTNDLVLVRVPGNHLVATIEKTRENIIRLRKLIGTQQEDGNRLNYALNNIGSNIFDYADLPNIRTWLSEVNKEQAIERIQVVERVFFVGDRSKDIDIRRDNANEPSLAQIPRDVRHKIFNFALQAELNDREAGNDLIKLGLFGSFTPNECNDALAELVARRTAPKSN